MYRYDDTSGAEMAGSSVCLLNSEHTMKKRRTITTMSNKEAKGKQNIDQTILWRLLELLLYCRKLVVFLSVQLVLPV